MAPGRELIVSLEDEALESWEEKEKVQLAAWPRVDERLIVIISSIASSQKLVIALP